MLSRRMGFSSQGISVRSPCQRHFRPSPASNHSRKKGETVKTREAARQGLVLTVSPLPAQKKREGRKEKGKKVSAIFVKDAKLSAAISAGVFYRCSLFPAWFRG